MKKLLMMAVIAALSSSAWANFSYQLDVRHVEEGTIPAGTIPAAFTVMLVDKRLDGVAQVKETWKINLADLGLKNYSAYVANGRFDVVSYYNTEGIFTTTLNGITYSIKYDSGFGGYQLQLNDTDIGTSEFLFNGVAEQDIANYAAENMKTVLLVGNKQIAELAAPLNAGGAAQLGTTAQLKEIPTPVPEPTSGMFVLLGVVGLMLRRRRAA